MLSREGRRTELAKVTVGTTFRTKLNLEGLSVLRVAIPAWRVLGARLGVRETHVSDSRCSCQSRQFPGKVPGGLGRAAAVRRRPSASLTRSQSQEVGEIQHTTHGECNGSVAISDHGVFGKQSTWTINALTGHIRLGNLQELHTEIPVRIRRKCPGPLVSLMFLATGCASPTYAIGGRMRRYNPLMLRAARE